jgi:methyl-accepting chemotaxis protein
MIIFTTDSPVAYVYAFVLAPVLMVYADSKLMIRFTTVGTIGNIIQVAVLFVNGKIAEFDMADIEIRIGSVVLFSFFLSSSVAVIMHNNRRQINEIAKEKEHTTQLVEQLLNVSSEITDNITTVSSKMKVLEDLSNRTMNAMQEVAQGTGDTANSIEVQMQKTEDIQNTVVQVKDTSDAIDKNIELTKSELGKAQKNIDDLIHYVSVSNEKNERVSSELAELSEHTNQMQSIILMIDEITTQTSLLSLNASIEAARAGEAGKGFAVVASEISALATQTQSATDNITVLISNISSKLKQVVAVVEEMIDNSNAQNDAARGTAKIFTEISDSADGVYEKTNSLMNLVDNLSHANEAIVEGIETISAATEEVTAHSNETFESTSENLTVTAEISNIINTLSELAQGLAAENN